MASLTDINAKLEANRHALAEATQNRQDLLKQQKRLLNQRQKVIETLTESEDTIYALHKADVFKLISDIAKQYNCTAIKINSFVWGFKNRYGTTTFRVKNSRNYIPTEIGVNRKRYKTRSWHQLREDEYADQSADYFVFLITNRSIPDSFNQFIFKRTDIEKEALKRIGKTKVATFYFGLNLDGQPVEGRMNQSKPRLLNVNCMDWGQLVPKEKGSELNDK